jgi:hypothetical protein
MRNRFAVPLIVVGLLAAGLAHGRSQPGGSPAPPPIDPQLVQDQDDMTWADYRPIPGTSWADNS